MGVFEIPFIIAGWLFTAGVAGVGGAFALQGKNTTQINAIREASDKKIEKIIDTYEQKTQSLILSNNQQNQSVLEHIKNVEKALNDMRAELPEKYTLRSDYLRLVDKVEELSLQVYQHKEIIAKVVEIQ